MTVSYTADFHITHLTELTPSPLMTFPTLFKPTLQLSKTILKLETHLFTKHLCQILCKMLCSAPRWLPLCPDSTRSGRNFSHPHTSLPTPMSAMRDFSRFFNYTFFTKSISLDLQTSICSNYAFFLATQSMLIFGCTNTLIPHRHIYA